MRKEWWLLLLAGALEVVWVSGLKHAGNWWQWLITLVSIVFSFKVFLDSAAKLPIGTVYVIFTGLGTAGTVLAEIVIFGEAANPLKLVLIGVLAAGVLGLKLVTGEADIREKESEA
ncbi:multidrug efflux SMR transporter subunit YkkC [Paenibacillus sp. JCM 10914]|uniref:DMT family transporter n=1 Tax=Paenibacillus sp. JCM 10914 TaxID=1236974 RepID=UPI0003CC75D9|nr:SMR family transporter [Paenibacillus sp. JCM 10914]GAE06930.1 quaternary ammonium compound-resistance protein sugE [Paenibacillus sp. JCM 10914]